MTLRPFPSRFLPVLLLLLALSTAFLFGNDRGGFYRPGHHDWATAQQMAQAMNLSPRHGFLPFIYRTLDRDGNPSYSVYNRWPIGGYALIKLATLPVAGDLSGQIYSARMLMLFFFVGTALLAYLALCRLDADRWVAATAVLLTFSSYYLLYYNDMVATECGMAVFGVLLTSHGMVVFAQEGRFRQLLVKACAALLLGWQVYALLLPFVVLGLASELTGVRSARAGSVLRSFQRAGAMLLRSRHLKLGIVTLLFGAALLSCNLAREYVALDGHYPPAKLPSVVSLKQRVAAPVSEEIRGHADWYPQTWGAFLGNEFYRIGGMGLPLGWHPLRTPLPGQIFRDDGVLMHPTGVLVAVAGASMLVIGIVGLAFVRHRILLASLLLSGFCWAIPLRHFVRFHDFQAVFHIGIPLLCFFFLMLFLCGLAGRRLIPALAVAASTILALSAVQASRIGHSPETAARKAEIMDDFGVIRSMVDDDHVVCIPASARDAEIGGAPFSTSYFLAGTTIEYGKRRWETRRAARLTRGRCYLADFVILPTRHPGPALLTPDNRHQFLYDQVLFARIFDDQLVSPVVESDSDVYLRDGYLIHVDEDCKNLDAEPFLYVHPIDVNDLPETLASIT